MMYRRNPAVVAQTVADRVMMLNPAAGDLITLSPTGAEVWRALATPGSCDDIVNRLQAEYPETDLAVMRGDIDAFLKRLEATGVILIV
jgi:Coenzyme PQQ synthesis protein D (PqqD)